MAFKTEQEVQPENIEMIGHPVQESSCVKTRPWPSSDKQSPNHPGPADTTGTNSKPVFAHGEEMTKTGVEEEGLAVFGMMEEAEGVEEGKMEEKAEEKVAEAELGVLCSFEGMPGSYLSPPENMEALPQEAEPQSPTFTAEHEPHLATSMTKREPTLTVEHEPHLASPMTKPEPTVTAELGPHLATPMAEHKYRPDGSTAEGHIKVTDRIAGQKKVFRKRQKAKPKMLTAEAAGTEGGPQNTRAPFRLQDFMCFKISKRYTVLLLLVLLAFPVNSNETSKQRTELPSSATPSAASLGQCAVCLDPRCATIVTKSFPANSNSRIQDWWKGSPQTEIPMCSKDSLMPDAPCKMANGSLVQSTNETLHFEGVDSSGKGHTFPSVNMPCADLNLPSKPSPAPIRNTSPPAATNNSVADNKDSGSGSGSRIGIGILIISIVISIIIGVGIGIGIGFLIWKRKSCGQGQDREPAHDPEDRNENTMEMQSLKGEVANENVNGVH